MDAPDRVGAFEQRVGKRWITWGGSLALFVAVALFFKMWVDTGQAGRIFTPTVRVVLGGAFGLALLYAGQRAVRTLRALGQGLLGTGLAVLYLTVFAGLAYYHLYGRDPAFAMLLAITAAGTVLAVRHDAQPIAILSLLGGLFTPVVLATGEDHRDALLTYVTLLDLGVLAVALARGWRALDVIAFVGSWVLFGGWFAQHYDATMMAPTMAWATVLYLVFLVMPFAYHLRRGLPIGDARFVLALANALILISAARTLLGDHPTVIAACSVAMSGAYTLLGAWTRRRMPQDGRAIFGFLTLAVGFLTLAVPLRLEGYGLTLAWAIEGPVLLALGLRHRYFPVRVAGLVVLGLAAVPLLEGGVPFASQLCVPAAAGLYAWMLHRRRGDERDDALRGFSAAGAIALGLAIVHVHFHRTGGDAAPWLVVLPWLVASYGLLEARARTWGVLAAMGATLFAALSYGLAPWPDALYVNPRFAVALATLALSLKIRHRDVTYGAIAALWVLLSVETYGHFAHAGVHGAAGMALTFVWGAFAVALVAGGFARHLRALRLAGLGLFGLTAGKLVIVDLATVHQGYRVLSFLVLGLLMIAASYVYHRVERT